MTAPLPVLVPTPERPDATVLAVDVGGTKLAAGIVDGTGSLLHSDQVPTAGSDSEDLFSRLGDLVGSVLGRAEHRPMACGIGCGGPMDPNGVSPLNIPQWRAFPLRERLAELLGSGVGIDAVGIDNDAKALALGEGWAGAAAGESNFLAMVVSTGVGGGIVLDGRLLDGGSANAGHVGHVVVEPHGHRCACGAVGCLEAEASGSAIERITGRPAARADAVTIERTGAMVGRGVASVANLLDLRLAVVAGSVALGFGEPFFEAASRELAERCRLDFSRGAEIRPAGLGADGPLIGAGAVGWRALGSR